MESHGAAARGRGPDALHRLELLVEQLSLNQSGHAKHASAPILARSFQHSCCPGFVSRRRSSELRTSHLPMPRCHRTPNLYPVVVRSDLNDCTQSGQEVTRRSHTGPTGARTCNASIADNGSESAAASGEKTVLNSEMVFWADGGPSLAGVPNAG